MEDLIFSINAKSVTSKRFDGKVRQFNISVDCKLIVDGGLLII